MSKKPEQRAIDRQALTAATFVEIVDSLVDDFDVIDVLTHLTSRCVELLEAAAAGILLADADGQLRVIGASTEQYCDRSGSGDARGRSSPRASAARADQSDLDRAGQGDDRRARWSRHGQCVHHAAVVCPKQQPDAHRGCRVHRRGHRGYRVLGRQRSPVAERVEDRNTT